MADFQTLNLCISLNLSHMCTYFCKDLLTGYCLYLVKKFDSCPSSVFKLILLPTVGLTSREIRVKNFGVQVFVNFRGGGGGSPLRRVTGSDTF